MKTKIVGAVVVIAVLLTVVGCGKLAASIEPAPPAGPSADVVLAEVGAGGILCLETRTTIRGLPGQADLVAAQRADVVDLAQFSSNRTGMTLNEGRACAEVVRLPVTVRCHLPLYVRHDLPVGVTVVETMRIVHGYSAVPSDVAEMMDACVSGRGRWERVE